MKTYLAAETRTVISVSKHAGLLHDTEVDLDEETFDQIQKIEALFDHYQEQLKKLKKAMK